MLIHPSAISLAAFEISIDGDKMLSLRTLLDILTNITAITINKTETTSKTIVAIKDVLKAFQAVSKLSEEIAFKSDAIVFTAEFTSSFINL